jgi:hypothetical protein
MIETPQLNPSKTLLCRYSLQNTLLETIESHLSICELLFFTFALHSFHIYFFHYPCAVYLNIAFGFCLYCIWIWTNLSSFMLHAIHFRLVNKSIAELKKNHFTAYWNRYWPIIFGGSSLRGCVHILWIFVDYSSFLIVTFSTNSPTLTPLQNSPQKIISNWFFIGSILKRYENNLTLGLKTDFCIKRKFIFWELLLPFCFFFIPCFCFTLKIEQKNMNFHSTMSSRNE